MLDSVSDQFLVKHMTAAAAVPTPDSDVASNVGKWDLLLKQQGLGVFSLLSSCYSALLVT